MTTAMSLPVSGDQYEWRSCPTDSGGVWITVTRVARDGSWADIACYDGHREWRKRQQLPFPSTFRKVSP